MMKTAICALGVILVCVIGVTDAAERGIDVEVTLSGAQGGGSTTLNTITKRSDKGSHTSSSGGKVNYIIGKQLKIADGGGGTLVLTVDLTMTREERPVESWSRRIMITGNGKMYFKPFQGIEMTVASKGFEIES